MVSKTLDHLGYLNITFTALMNRLIKTITKMKHAMLKCISVLVLVNWNNTVSYLHSINWQHSFASYNARACNIETAWLFIPPPLSMCPLGYQFWLLLWIVLFCANPNHNRHWSRGQSHSKLEELRKRWAFSLLWF